MRDYTRGERCLMQLLQESLDDPTCRAVRTVLGLPRRAAGGRCRAARGRDRRGRSPPAARPGARAGAAQDVARRRVRQRGRIPADEARSRARPSSTPTPRSGARSVACDASPRDGRRPTRCTRPASGCSPRGAPTWPARPEVVVDLPAVGFRAFTASVADHLAAVGRLDRASPTVPRPPDDLRDLGSAEEAAWWRDAIDAAALGDRRGRSPGAARRGCHLDPLADHRRCRRAAPGRCLRVLPLLIHRQP